jgi:hypothetical protein
MRKTENNHNKLLNQSSIKSLNTIKMKKMKKSLLTLLTAILIGSSFTSCIENTVPDEVTAIYAGQANVLAAEAALLNAQANLAASETARTAAEAAFLQAQARAEDARSAALAAQAAIDQAMAEAQIAAMAAQTAIDQAQSAAAIAAAEAAAAQQRAESDARIAAMIAAMENANAQAAAQLALAEIAQQQAVLNLQIAQDQWAMDMAQIARDIAAAEALAANAAETAAANAIQTAFNNYITQKVQLDNLTSTEARDQLSILQHMRSMVEDVLTDEALLNQLVANVTIEEADLVVLQGMLADYQALLAPGTTLGDRIALRDTYQASIDANDNLIHDMNTEIAMLAEADNAAWIALDDTGYNQVELSLNVLRNQYQNARNAAENARDNSAAATAAAKVIADNIVRLQDIVDNYDTKLADFEAAIATAETAETAAETAETAAGAAETAAEAAIVGATADLTAAQAALVIVETAEATALTSLQTAVNAYSAALAGQTDTAPLETDVTNAEAAIVNAQAAYAAAKAIFDADPSGTTWLDGGVDARLGRHNDDGVSIETFVEILTISGPVGPAQTATFGATVFTNQPDVTTAGGTVTGNAYRNFVDADDDGDVYFNIEADDVAPAGDNAFVLNSAATALDASKAALVIAQANLAAVVLANDVSDELADYNDATAFYETAQAQVTAAEGVVTTATAAVATAVAAEAAAAGAHDAAIAALAAAVTDTADANADLTTFKISTELEYQNELEAALVDQDVNADLIATEDALFIELDALAKELAATIDAGPAFTAEQIAAKDAYEAANAALIAKETELNMLFNENFSLQNYITLIDISAEADIVTMITNKEAEILASEISIVAAQALVDNFSSRTADFNLIILEGLEAQLATTQLQIETQQLVVDQMKAILDSLL